MAMSSCCWLNPLPSSPLDPTSSTSLPTKPSLVPRKSEERLSWKKKYVVGIACTLIFGLEMGDTAMTSISGSNSMAGELAMESQQLPNNKKKKSIKVARWSDKRICPPWHFNSLETIVPENLPRKSSAHRKWEGVTYSSKLAPPVKFLAKSRTGCFSL